MPFKIDKTITITGKDADILPTIFNFAEEHMAQVETDNPSYTSTYFSECSETIERFRETRKWEEG